MAEVVELPLASVRPDPEQHRQVFPDDYIRGLADSIVSQGQITPVKVRPDTNGGPTPYVVIDGECRYRACVLAGLAAIRAEVCEGLSAFEVANIQGAANLSRRDVEPCAAGRALRKSIDTLRQEKSWLSEEEARKIVQDAYGLTGQYVIPKLNLLLLPPEVQVLVDKRSIGEQAALALLPLVEKGEEAQAVRLALSVQSGSLRPSDVSTAVNAYLGAQSQGSLFGGDEGKATKERKTTRDALTRAVYLWEQGTALVFGQDRQEGFDLSTLRADELAVLEVKAGGLLRSLQGIFADLQAAQGKTPDIQPDSAPIRAPQPVTPAIPDALPTPRPEVSLPSPRQAPPTKPTLPNGVRAGMHGTWLWVFGVAGPGGSSLSWRLQRAGAKWASGRRAWYAPRPDEQEAVRAVLADYQEPGDQGIAAEAAG